MDIRFIGPLGKVTGSCTWMRDLSRNWSFLIDCGMQQGERTAATWNSCEEWPFDPASLQFVVLTHAHIDHSGLLPVLYKRGFSGKVLCTDETREIAQLVLRDAARFSGSPFAEKDVALIKWHTPGGTTRQGGFHPVDNDLFVRFFRSGHIVGAVSVTILWGPQGPDQKSIVFSGDVGPGGEDTEVLPFLRYPLHPKPGNFAVLESTYGGVVRPDAEKSPAVRRARLQELLDRVLSSGGTLAIPAFSVGRTQDVLFDMHMIVAENPDKYGAIKFYLDSPIGQKVNKITLDALKSVQVNSTGKVRPQWLGKQIFRELGLDKDNPSHTDFALKVCAMTLGLGSPMTVQARYGNEVARRWRPIFAAVKDRTALISQKDHGPRVVVMSSGMGDGGPAAQWLPALAQSEKNIVALSGYCSPATIGGQLLELMSAPLDQRALHTGDLVWLNQDGTQQCRIPVKNIRAAIFKLSGYSAHGDQTDLVNWLFENHKGMVKQSLGDVVFLQHGANEQRDALAEAIAARADEWGLDVQVVKPRESDGCWFDLESGGANISRELKRQDIEAAIRRLEHELACLE